MDAKVHELGLTLYSHYTVTFLAAQLTSLHFYIMLILHLVEFPGEAAATFIPKRGIIHVL